MRDHLVFYVNGARHEVRGREAGLTLSDYLRDGRGKDSERLPGTKIACAEGDCGACTVLVGEADRKANEFSYKTIDACIAFVYLMDRRHVVTVEGLADPAAELTPVQQAMVDCHGSQCGFCTPGFVMAMHGLVEARQDQTAGELTDDELRLGLSGNLCRCTGYSQILDAGRRCHPSAIGTVAKRFDTTAMLADFAELGEAAVHVNAKPPTESNGHHNAEVEAFLPTTVDELIQQRAARPDAKLVSGATDVGVQFNHRKIAPESIITTGTVPELHRLEVVDGELIIGAAVTWSRIEDFCQERLPEYHQILTRFGSPQVRHAGTLVGNLANASPIADSIPFHCAAGATIELAGVNGTRSVPIESFYLGYKKLDLRPEEIITAVSTPMPTESTRVKLYKISKRRDMDISTVTLAIWIELAGETISTVRLAAGGVGPVVLRLPEAEAALAGEPLTLGAMEAAGRIARDEITPLSDVRGSSDYRLKLVENLFAKCWHDLSSTTAGV